MASTLVDLVKINITSTGTGALKLGTAATGYRGIEALTNGRVYSYSIQQGGNWEVGRGTYLSASDTLVRSVLFSSSGGAAIKITGGAQVAFTALAEDLNVVQLAADIEAVAAQAAADAATASTAAGTATSAADGAADLFASASGKLDTIITPELYGATGSGDDTTALADAMTASVALGARLKLRRARTYSFTQLTIPNGCVIESNGATLRILPGLTGDAVSLTIGDDVQADRLRISTPGTEANTTMVLIGARLVTERIKLVADSQRAGEGITTTGDELDIGRLITRNIDRPIHLNNGVNVTPTTGTRIGFLDCQSYVRGFRATNCDRWTIGGYRMRDRSPNSQNTAVGTGSLSGSNLTISATARGTWYNSTSGGARIYNSAGAYVGTISGAPTGNVYPMTGLTGAAIIGGVVYGRRMADRVGHNGLLISDCCDFEVGEGLIHQSGEHAIRIAGTMRKSVGGTIGRTTVDSCGGCAFKINPLSPIPTENMTVGPIYGIDVGDFDDSGPGENKEVIRISHAREIRIEGTFSDSRTEAINSSYVAKLNDCSSVTINGLGGVANNAGIIFDKTSDVGGTFATGSISGTTMTITAVLSGTFEVGAAIFAGTAYCGEIIALGTGTGGAGTYTLSQASTVASTALAGNPREAGPVTGVRIHNYGNVLSSPTNAVVFDMDGQAIGEIYIQFAGARGWTGNVASFTGTPTVTGPIVFTGSISGSATPTFNNAPATTEVRADLIWYGRRITGQVSLLDGQYGGWQNVVGAAFDPSNVKGSQIMANASGATAGTGNYGAAYEFTRPGSTRRGAAVAVRQMGSAVNNTGVEILVGTNLGSTDALQPAVQVTHERALGIPDGITAPTTAAGWAQIYVDAADGDLKIKFGDGTVKTIVLDS